GGTGLGLAISKELIERMHGRVGFDTEPGQGCCFWFELPVADAR
ncbi:ATP-binding protein, partial [Stutzerimonas nitrititolerans]